MKAILTATGLIVVASCAIAETIPYSSYIVGYEDKNLNRGWNKIELNFDAVGVCTAFTTLDKVIKFSPVESMLGDEIVFDLDGYHQKYRIDSYDDRTEKFTLKKIRQKDNIPEQISLDWIPLPKVFWINHLTTNSVCLTQSGQIDGDMRRTVDSQTAITSDSAQPFLRIIPVNPDSKEYRYTLQGGKISVDKP